MTTQFETDINTNSVIQVAYTPDPLFSTAAPEPAERAGAASSALQDKIDDSGLALGAFYNVNTNPQLAAAVRAEADPEAGAGARGPLRAYKEDNEATTMQHHAVQEDAEGRLDEMPRLHATNLYTVNAAHDAYNQSVHQIQSGKGRRAPDYGVIASAIANLKLMRSNLEADMVRLRDE